MNECRAEDEELSRLRWQCRRGMLELDVALRRFLDREYAGLGERERAAFSRLLGVDDQTLFAWLMGRARPEDAERRALVDRLRRDGSASGP
jgi:antitoxin CptB